MNLQPHLETERLVLRAFDLADAPVVQRLAGVYEVAAMTLNVPHPYEDGIAENFIENTWESWKGGSPTFAITLRENGELVGCIGLGVRARFQHAEMGYWVGVPYWGQGYATEAGSALLKFGFETLHLHRIYASVLVGNEASARVQEKMGMKYEGRFREHYLRWGKWHDSDFRGILVSDWEALRSSKAVRSKGVRSRGEGMRNC